MGAVCVVETFWFLTSPGRFVAMALEFAAYISIVVMLHLPVFRNCSSIKAIKHSPRRRTHGGVLKY
jgi:hypothetical protein